MRTITVNALHCHQSTYNLRQITVLAGKIHDPLTREWLADKIVARHNADEFFNGVSDSQVKSVNHALKVLNDTRRV
jgi:hypothetical protein